MSRMSHHFRFQLATVGGVLILMSLLEPVAPAVADELHSCLVRVPRDAEPPAGPWILGLAAKADPSVFTDPGADTTSAETTRATPAPGLPMRGKSAAPNIGMLVGGMVGMVLGVSLSRGTPHTPSTGDAWEDLGNSIGDSMGDAMGDAGRMLGLTLLGALLGYAVGSAIASEPQPPIEYTPPRPKSRTAAASVAPADSAAADASAGR
jgi:hypothetical protein